MAGLARESDGQLAARVGIAEQDFGNRVAALTAGFPGLQDRRNVLRRPTDAQRSAVQKHKHHRLAERHDGLEQLLLPSRQIERGARGGLAGHVGFLAEHHHNDIRCTRRCHGRLEGRLGLFRCLHGLRVGPGHHIVEKRNDLAPDFRAGSICHLRFWQLGAHAFQYRYGRRRMAKDHP